MPEQEGYESGQCVASQGCQRRATHGYICGAHFERMGAMLRDIEDEAAILSAVPSMQQRIGSGKGSLASERAPARLDVLVHTDRRRGTGRSETDDDALAAGDTLPILDVLHSWARIVREERDFTGRSDVTVSGERDTLSRNLEWAAAQPWVDEFYADLSSLLGQLRAANGQRPERPYCDCPTLPGGEPCPGSVWIHDEIQPVWRRYVDRCAQSWESAPGPAVCDMCGTVWATAADRARLDRMVDDKRNQTSAEMLTAQEIADRLGKTINAVRIMASRAGVKAVDGRYDAQAFGLASDVA